MKTIKISCTIIIFSFFFSCEKESTPPIKIPDSFLRGMINNTDSLIVNAPNQHSGYQYFPNPDKKYYEEGPHITFPFNNQETEAIYIHFLLKFDSLNRPPNSEMPVIKNTDALIDTLARPGWYFTNDFTPGTFRKTVSVEYYIRTDLDAIFYSPYHRKEDDSNSSQPVFKIYEALKYKHPEQGSGILINGDFSCIMYNSKNFNDSIIFDNIRYQAFIKHPWDSWFE